MSMNCSVLGLTPAQIEGLRAMPSLVGPLVMVAEVDQSPAPYDEWIKRLSPELRQKVEANRTAHQASPAGKEELARIAQAISEAREQIAALGPFEQALSLAGMWDVLHYLLTGHAGPENAPGDLLMSGDALGEDIGYGPARLHDPAATRDFSRFLETQDVARLRARIDVGEMTRLDIYGTTVRPGEEADYEKELREDTVPYYFTRLRDYVRTMSAKGNGLLVWIS